MRERASVLADVSVDRDGPAPPVRQLEGQLATMVREGRLEPGRRLPSTRRLASAVGLHRNTVAVAYRRLAAREFLESRHGARARVVAVADRQVRGPVDRVLAAAEERETARLMVAELRAALPRGIAVKPLVAGAPPGGDSARRQLVAALPGPALRRFARESPLRLRQHRRPAVRAALLRAPLLAVVAVATASPPLREALLSDVERIRGRELSVRVAPVRDDHRWTAEDGPAPAADLVIADRLAADALCGASSSPSGPAVVRTRLLCRDPLAADAPDLGGRGVGIVRRSDPSGR